jgi:hypothetical protein
MEKSRCFFGNLSFGLWPKASDHEVTSDIGWLLYSTWIQGEVRSSSSLLSPTAHVIGAKWKPICTTNGFNKKKELDNPS